ncbi:U-scoloptoxin(01)-Er1a-like isoform X1 [Amphibalanus amphitrite]|uniref:U-scoloptoxin(01)-Er1a-like isoform X1 n=2 Tax=Amphibalanus amphitrite TaxID=1232801 RepID=UPI001C91ECA1|nr:U-scoloptoxin(01)-Er1a-like isoform X1 [Amphibalanus amphitrite]
MGGAPVGPLCSLVVSRRNIATLSSSSAMARLLFATLAAALVAMVTARMAYELSDGADSIVPNLVQSFSCDGRAYGYYADVSNDCQLFHICVPVLGADGEVLSTDQYSFLCGNQTIFDQATLTCNYPVDSLPCEDAESMYSLRNDEFFRKLDGSEA